MTIPRPGLFWRALVAAALAIVILANAHLVYVATTTQPLCVDHVKAGDARPSAGDPAQSAGSFSAAGSSC
jgi:hypothetical protein